MSTGSPSTSSKGARSIAASIATGSIRPSPWRQRCCDRPTVSSSPRRPCATDHPRRRRIGAMPRCAPAPPTCPMPPAARASSPFDYLANSCIIVVNDVARDDMDQLAAAYRELFLAASGGGLGLFTAIARLRAVHRRLMVPLARAGLPLYAQHVDPIDTGTLVDMFRAERHSCLLGTDAVRDGVDVPGDLAPADRARPGAVEPAHNPGTGPPRAVRRRRLAGYGGAAQAQAGLRAADPPRRRPRRIRRSRFTPCLALLHCLSAGHADFPHGIGGGDRCTCEVRQRQSGVRQ